MCIRDRLITWGKMQYIKQIARTQQMKKEDIAIGISLGAANSCVAVTRNNKTEVIPNEYGNATTPSYVSFTDEGRLVGEAARSKVMRNPINTVFGVKRMLGRKFSEKAVQDGLRVWPFKVLPDAEDKPVITVEDGEETKQFYAEEIHAMVIAKMKTIAENYLGRSITKAVLTVPSYFNDAQRRATKDAGTIAGLDVLRIINEPISAMIPYELYDEKERGEKFAVVLKIGSESLDATMASIEEGVYETKEFGRDDHLGGNDFDNRMVEYCKSEFKKRTGLDVSKNLRVLRRLKIECERAKRVLSYKAQALVLVKDLMEGIDFSLTITREKFEEINTDLFQKCIPQFDRVLRYSEVTKNQISKVVLAGGSTNIPKIIAIVRDYFGMEPEKSINPDEVAAIGAAKQASICISTPPKNDWVCCCFDFTRLTLGMEEDGHIVPIIPKNTIIPCKKTRKFGTGENGQRSMAVKVYEGEFSVAWKNKLMCSFEIIDIPPAPRGVHNIEVKLEIDPNSNLKVTVTESWSNKVTEVSITKLTKKLSMEEIDRLIKEAEMFAKEEREQKKLHGCKIAIKRLCDDLKDMLNSPKHEFTEEEKISAEKLTVHALSLIHISEPTRPY
eukprot:TRINITY_DN14614_c0_g1_i4.p1 TRINITY_DN14614_c0_g1~~TRINITY_DN14614_c0_g1_i4.p1  ORF type:complete len:614 (-),score=98.17 TRINITY_DN14614_c0_g1_i4:48-1889(-)